MNLSGRLKNILKVKQIESLTWDNFLAIFLSFGIIVPIFFQIEGGVFRDNAIVFDSQGLIEKLPMPVSVIVCLAGILVLTARRRKIPTSLFWIFLYVVFIFLSLLVRTQHGDFSSDIIVLVQFTLPMFAYVLGTLYETMDRKLLILPGVFMFVVCLLMPTQLYCSLLQAGFEDGSSTLSPSLYLFSIYQHLQYVPTVLVSGFVVVLFALGNHEKWRKWTLFFMPVIIIYVFISSSILSLVLLIFSLAVWSVLYNRKKMHVRSWIRIGIVITSSAFLISGYMYTFREYNMMKEKLTFLQGKDLKSVHITGLAERSIYWRYYSAAVTKDAKSFFLEVTNRNPEPDTRAPIIIIWIFYFISALSR